MLPRRRRFYCKRLFFSALTSEAVRQLSSFFGYLMDQVTWSVKDVHVRVRVGDVIEVFDVPSVTLHYYL